MHIMCTPNTYKDSIAIDSKVNIVHIMPELLKETHQPVSYRLPNGKHRNHKILCSLIISGLPIVFSYSINEEKQLE